MKYNTPGQLIITNEKFKYIRRAKSLRLPCKHHNVLQMTQQHAFKQPHILHVFNVLCQYSSGDSGEGLPSTIVANEGEEKTFSAVAPSSL